MEAFLASTGLVALAEIGDKTQIATVALAAKYAAIGAVVAGTTLGMLRGTAATLFFGVGALTLVLAD